MIDKTFDRIHTMLESVDPNHDRNSKSGKAQAMRALLGSIRPNYEMDAICVCGWQGKIVDTHEESYTSGGNSWERLAGRKGEHYSCPDCGQLIWKYYWMIS